MNRLNASNCEWHNIQVLKNRFLDKDNCHSYNSATIFYLSPGDYSITIFVQQPSENQTLCVREYLEQYYSFFLTFRWNLILISVLFSLMYSFLIWCCFGDLITKTIGMQHWLANWQKFVRARRVITMRLEVNVNVFKYNWRC